MPKKKRKRLPKEKRREAIIASAVPLFAQNGFKGTTTKELAKASGVSEALLYKHFPSKQILYKEIQKSCFRKREEYVSLVNTLEPSTQNMVFVLWYFFQRTVCGGLYRDGVVGESLPRLILNSVQEDGRFASSIIEDNSAVWRKPLLACMAAARESGDIQAIPAEEDSDFTWVIHNIGFSSMLFALPKEPVIKIELPIEKYAESCILFILRGLGLSKERIEELYKPDEFAKLLENA